jgi:hypothetical protein
MSASRRVNKYKGYVIETRAFGTGKEKFASYRLLVESAPLRPPFMQVLPKSYPNEDMAHHAAETQARRVVDQMLAPEADGNMGGAAKNGVPGDSQP